MTDAPDLTPDELLARTGRLVRQRREEMGLTQQELAARSKVGTTTLRKLEKGQQDSYRPMNLGQISTALLWPFDAIERLLNGDSDPDPLRTAATGQPPGDLEAVLTELINQVAAIESRLTQVEAAVDRSAPSP